MRVNEAASAYGQAVARYREAAGHLQSAYTLAAEPGSTGAHLAELATRLAEQRIQLTDLSQRLQLPPPLLDGISPAATVSYSDAFNQAQRGVQQMATELSGLRRLTEPRLLPGASSFARAGLTYGAWSLLGWLVQCTLLVATNGTNAGAAVGALCGMPLVAFAGSYLTLQTLGQPRAGAKHDYSLKVGAVICFLAMPLAWLLLLAVLAAIR